MRFLLSRLLRASLLMVGVSVLCFLFMQMAHGNFFDEMKLNPQISPETIASLRAHYGLDRPVIVRYKRWAVSVLQGDLGYSLAYNVPVAPLLWKRAQHTLILTSAAAVLTWIIAVPLGVCTASRRGRPADKFVGSAIGLLISVPEIVMALALLAIVVRWRLLPVGGMRSLGSEEFTGWLRFRDLITHMLLPITILLLGGVPVVERHVRASVVEALNTSYIRAARGMGISPARILVRHALPLAANSAISLFGLSVAGLIGGSLLVEAITGWPGLGPLLLEATLSRDLYVVIGTVLLSAGFLVAGNLISDVLLLIADPRVGAGETSAQ